MIVADANLIVYLLVSGAYTAASEGALACDPDWRVPPLWRSEVRNALLGHVRSEELPLPDAVAALEYAERLLGAAEERVDSRRVLELALASGASAYDCEYVALAEQLRAPLVTADRRLLQAFPTTTLPLENFAPPGT